MKTRIRTSLSFVLATIVAAVVLMVPASAFANEGTSNFSIDAMYRLYNPNSGEHFYTADESERDGLVEVGWNNEGVGWYAPVYSDTPVYRFYNANGGEHHYTMSVDEANNLLMAGWTYEGVGWYSDDAKSVMLYRDYNPNAFANNHNYTTSASEHQSLVDVGWNAEGDAWYGVVMHHAVVKVEGYNEFVINVDAMNAPKSAENFVNLAKSGYYNGRAFYRIQDGFVMQGGTKGDTASGHDPELTPVIGEFSENGVDNQLADSFQRGTVALARATDFNSATSTFFVTLENSMLVSLNLNGKYAAFGTINEAGMQIVDAICRDYVGYTSGEMSTISDPSKMPRIESITIVD